MIAPRHAAVPALIALVAAAGHAHAASVHVTSQERSVAATMIVHGDSTTQRFDYLSGDEWKKLAQVVVDDRVRSRAVALTTVKETGNGMILRSRNRVGIESTLDVDAESFIAETAAKDAPLGKAFPTGAPVSGSARLAGVAESWFDVAFNVTKTMTFNLFALGDDAVADSLGIEGKFHVSLTKGATSIFEFTDAMGAGPNGPVYAAGQLTPGSYRFRVFAAIAGESAIKVPIEVDSKLTLTNIAPVVAPPVEAVPSPAAAGLGLAMLTILGLRRRGA